nr:hypothetical protein [Tanacetum cinerariifolium]
MISLEVFDHLILSAFAFGDKYFIHSRLVIMERNGVLYAMQRQSFDEFMLSVFRKCIMLEISEELEAAFEHPVRRVTCGYLWPVLEGTTGTLLAMPSHFHKKCRWGTVFATGRRSFIEPGTGLRMKRINRRTRVPIGLYTCHIKENMTIKEVRGELVMEWKTKVTTKEGVVIKFHGKFHGYKLATEEELEENKGLKEV